MLKVKDVKTKLGRKKARFVLLIIFAAIICIVFATSTQKSCGYSETDCGPRVVLKGSTFTADIADSEAERVQGLSGREGMDPWTVKTFVFETPGQYCFWMKDMKFSIDIVWLDSSKRVTQVKENAQPASYPAQFCPKRPAMYVLEFVEGTAKGLKLHEGDQAYLAF